MNYSSTATPRATLDKLSNCTRKWHASTTRLFPSVSSRYSPMQKCTPPISFRARERERANRVNCVHVYSRAHTHTPHTPHTRARARTRTRGGRLEQGRFREWKWRGQTADKHSHSAKATRLRRAYDVPSGQANPLLRTRATLATPMEGWRRTLLRLCDPSTSSEGPLPFLPSFFFFFFFLLFNICVYFFSFFPPLEIFFKRFHTQRLSRSHHDCD